jgi:hypothetical protein
MLALPALLAAGCTTKVARVQSDSTIDLSGRWNDADSRLVAEAMISDCLNQRWLYKYDQMNKRPTVIIGKINNNSHEHINVETFSKDIERALLNSSKVDFLASKSERSQIREEKADQAENATEETAKPEHAETGADLMLIGTLNTIVDQEGNKSVVFYQTNMELVELQTNKKVWIGEKKIKKFVERAQATY